MGLLIGARRFFCTTIRASSVPRPRPENLKKRHRLRTQGRGIVQQNANPADAIYTATELSKLPNKTARMGINEGRRAEELSFQFEISNLKSQISAGMAVAGGTAP
jgi:hypothetical protein